MKFYLNSLLRHAFDLGLKGGWVVYLKGGWRNGRWMVSSIHKICTWFHQYGFINTQYGFINTQDMYNEKFMSVRGEYGFMQLIKKNEGWRSLECLFFTWWMLNRQSLGLVQLTIPFKVWRSLECLFFTWWMLNCQSLGLVQLTKPFKVWRSLECLFTL